MSTEPTGRTLRNKRQGPAQRTVRNKRTKLTESAEPDGAYSSHAPVDRGRETVKEESEDEHCDEVPAPKEPDGGLRPASLHDIYERMVHEDKWVLTSGRRVEDVIFEACNAMDLDPLASSPKRLFILDTSDPVTQGWFTKDEWNEITAGLPPLPDADQMLVGSFERFYSVKTTTRLRAVLNESDWMPDGVTYDRTLHSNLQWADMAIRKFLMLLEAPHKPLIQSHQEGWYSVNIWSDILDACLLDLEYMTVERRQCSCRASSRCENLHEQGLTAGEEPGYHLDGVIRTLGNYFEYGGMETKPNYTDDVTAMWWFGCTFGLVSSLRDMLFRLHKFVDDDPRITRQVQVVGISMAGLVLEYSRLGYPGVGYVCLLRREKMVQVPDNVERLPRLLRVLVVVAQLKELISVSYKTVQGRYLEQSGNSFCEELLRRHTGSGPRLGWPPDTLWG